MKKFILISVFFIVSCSGQSKYEQKTVTPKTNQSLLNEDY